MNWAIWFVIALVGGVAAILGSLMLLGSLLLWLIPAAKTTSPSSRPWLGRIKLLAVSLLLSLSGLGLLIAFPFPSR
jgi:hypothetical protein